jgi:hypothetical protein
MLHILSEQYISFLKVAMIVIMEYQLMSNKVAGTYYTEVGSKQVPNQ